MDLANGTFLALRVGQQFVGLGHEVVDGALGADDHVPDLVHFLADGHDGAHLFEENVNLAGLDQGPGGGGGGAVQRVRVLRLLLLVNDRLVDVVELAHHLAQVLRDNVDVELELLVDVLRVGADLAESLGHVVDHFGVHGLGDLDDVHADGLLLAGLGGKVVERQEVGVDLVLEHLQFGVDVGDLLVERE